MKQWIATVMTRELRALRREVESYPSDADLWELVPGIANPADLVGELRTVRGATLALFRTFDADAWRRRGTASGKPVSVRALAYMIPGHERHHTEILKTRYGIGS